MSQISVLLSRYVKYSFLVSDELGGPKYHLVKIACLNPLTQWQVKSSSTRLFRIWIKY